MKLAYPVTTPEVRAPHLAWSGNLRTIAPQLRALGYQGVELFVRDPRQCDADEIASTLHDHGLAVAAVGTGPVVVEDRLTFTDGDPSRRQAALERAKSIVDFAARLGSQMNVGKLRGNVGATPDAAAWRDEAFRELARHAALTGSELTLEPQARGIIDNLNSTAEALAWRERLGTRNVKVMLDTLHMHLEDPHPAASIVAARPHLAHIHLADTRRRAPGRGGIDFPTLLAVLQAMGYTRYLTVEIEQAPDSAAAAADAAAYLLPLLQRLSS